ncbi:MAG: Bd3614 family nucleic acid deaminase [Bdellovibrionaceae bacterium]|nr:Bd3614 family nucleic acid deaminase [Pseudobdellovibrionaceae bacterium]
MTERFDIDPLPTWLTLDQRPLALLWDEQTSQGYYCRLLAEPHQPETAVTRLISSLWHTLGPQALRVIRLPVWTTHPVTELERAFVRVAAKRIRAFPPPTDIFSRGHWNEVAAPPLPEAPSLPEPTPLTLGDAQAMHLVRELAHRVPRDSHARARTARAIAAVLVGADGQRLAWAVNSAGQDRTRHAEANLVQSWWRQTRSPLPPGARLYCTLKPCRMCAEMIWMAAANPERLQVHYLEHDPGPLAQATILEHKGVEQLWVPSSGNGDGV